MRNRPCGLQTFSAFFSKKLEIAIDRRRAGQAAGAQKPPLSMVSHVDR
jgi:hypothetical protein